MACPVQAKSSAGPAMVAADATARPAPAAVDAGARRAVASAATIAGPADDFACTGHAIAQPDRRGGRRANDRNSSLWYAFVGLGAAFVRPRAGFWGRQRDGCGPGPGLDRRDLFAR